MESLVRLSHEFNSHDLPWPWKGKPGIRVPCWGMVLLNCRLRTATITKVKKISASFLKVPTQSFCKFNMWHYDETLRRKWWFLNIYERFLQITWLRDSFLKRHPGIRFLYKLPEKWLPEARYYFVSTLKEAGHPDWARRGKSSRECEIKAGTLEEKRLFLRGFESLCLKGSPPHLRRGLAYGVWYRWMRSNTAAKYLALELGCAPCQLARSSPGLRNELIPPSC